MQNNSCGCCAPHEALAASSVNVTNDHGHDHGHDHGSDNLRRELATLGVSGIVFALILIFEGSIAARFGWFAPAMLYAVPYLLCGWSVLAGAGRLMARGDVMNEFTLMGGATLVAIGLGQYAEAVGVMLFYRLGEFFQELATDRSRRSVQSLLASKPSQARVVRGEEQVMVPVETVVADDVFLVRAGEIVPLDGVVLTGSSHLDQSPLTGESVPVFVEADSPVLGGSVNTGGVITVRATAAFADTHMARVLDMVENAVKHKAPTERFISRFARYYTPVVVAAALLVAILPPLLGDGDWRTWIYRALVLLVISCPCALVISIPLGYFAGIGAASRQGILVKGGNVLDALTHIKTVVFDKTGTLTQGVFQVSGLVPAEGVGEEELLRAAANAECDSNHPVARAVMRLAGDFFVREDGLRVREIPGKGMEAVTDDDTFLAGSARLLEERGVAVPDADHPGTVVHVARNERYLGCLRVDDAVRPEAAEAVASLKARGLRVIMLSGDRAVTARTVAEAVGLDGHEAELLPEGKVEALQRLSDKDSTAFVGDGINDAPSLALSRVGIAMGGVGAEAAVEAADAVILNDSPAQVARLFSLAARVRTIVWQNIFLALGVKTGFMALGIVGLSGLWEAVFADVGVALLAVLNASRAMRG